MVANMVFVQGQSGNPGGRPKRTWTWAGLLEKVGEETELKSGQKFKDLVSKRMWVDAVNGSLGAQKEIGNRMDGMPQQKVAVKGEITNILIGREPLRELEDESTG